MNADVSHAWIELHRCVEAYSRTTGESFNLIFTKIEADFNIDRTIKRKWPNLQQIREIALKLKREREDYLHLIRNLIKERRLEKKKGIRISTNTEFLNLMHKQTNHLKPKVGYWGWRKKRIAESEKK